MKAVLSQARLATLTGTGGVGKSRLAIRLAEALADDYPDGVWFVELATLADSVALSERVSSVLGVREQPGRPLEETLLDFVDQRRLFLVLDNCEHLLPACAQLADLLLRGCPHVRILATSRQSLGLTGEVSWRVPSLDLPEAGRLHTGAASEKDTVSIFMEYPAIQLFVERAVEIQPAFRVTPQCIRAVAHVCRQLDGIPLAIELAAARLKAMPAEQIASRLADRFRLLTGGSRTALPRQQTLRATMDWSYHLLSEAEQALLCRVSVFAGGWTLEAAEEVCASEGLEEVKILDLLTQLIDKSLVQYGDALPSVSGRGDEERPRYWLLETVREYAQEKLWDSSVKETVHRRHRDYFLRLAEVNQLQAPGAPDRTWLDRMEAEHDNLRAALSWSATTARGDDGLRLASVLWPFWELRGYWAEGREALERALEHGAGAAAELCAHALLAAGSLAFRMADHPRAKEWAARSLDLSREAGHQRLLADALMLLACLAWVEADYPEARSRYHESLAIWRQIRDQPGMTKSLAGLGAVALSQGDHPAARSYCEEEVALRREIGGARAIALSLYSQARLAAAEGERQRAVTHLQESLRLLRDIGDRSTTAIVLSDLGRALRGNGDTVGARACFEESLTIAQEIGDRWMTAASLSGLAHTEWRRGGPTAASGLYREALAILAQIGCRRSITVCLAGLATVAASTGQPQRAAQLLGATEALRAAIGISLPPEERDDLDLAMTATRQALGKVAFTMAWNEGRAMSREQVLTFVLEVDSPMAATTLPVES